MCVVRRCAGARTKAHRAMVRLRLLGAGPRLAGATLIVASLWVEFFRATSTPGGGMAPVPAFQNLTLGQDRHREVHHLQAESAEGSLTAIVGPNGAGKSRLLKEVTGVLAPLEGQVSFGCCVARTSPICRSNRISTGPSRSHWSISSQWVFGARSVPSAASRVAIAPASPKRFRPQPSKGSRLARSGCSRALGCSGRPLRGSCCRMRDSCCSTNPSQRSTFAPWPIFSRRNWRELTFFSPYLFRDRNLVERFFNRIKHCRHVATRYEKRAVNFRAFVKLAAIRIWLRVYESAY